MHGLLIVPGWYIVISASYSALSGKEHISLVGRYVAGPLYYHTMIVLQDCAAVYKYFGSTSVSQIFFRLR
jgi:hypothetical protein